MYYDEDLFKTLYLRTYDIQENFPIEGLAIEQIICVALSICLNNKNVPKSMVYNETIGIDIIYFNMLYDYILLRISEYYLMKKRNESEKKYSKEQFIEALLNNESVIQIDDTKQIDAYEKKIEYIINNYTIIYKNLYNRDYLITQKRKGDRTKYKIYNDGIIDDILPYLKYYDDPVFCNIRENKLTEIKFHDYEAFINKIREDIEGSHNKFTNIKLYELELYFNFEVIKDICGKINFWASSKKEQLIERYKNKLNLEIEKKIEDSINNMKEALSETFIQVATFEDINIRHVYLDMYEQIKNESDATVWYDSIHSYDIQLPILLILYVIHLLEKSKYSLNEICELIEQEQFRQSNHLSPYKIGKDFKEDDFTRVMKYFQTIRPSFGIVGKNYRKHHLEKDFLYGFTISELAFKYKIENSKVLSNIPKDAICINITSDLDNGFSISELEDKYQMSKIDIKKYIVEEAFERKIIESFNSGSSFDEISQKYDLTIDIIRKVIPPKIFATKITEDLFKGLKIRDCIKKYNMTWKNIKKYIIKEHYFIKIIIEEFKNGSSFENISVKHKIEIEFVKACISKEEIWVTLKSIKDRKPNITVKQLSDMLGVDKRTIQKYIDSEKIPQYSEKKNNP